MRWTYRIFPLLATLATACSSTPSTSSGGQSTTDAGADDARSASEPEVADAGTEPDAEPVPEPKAPTIGSLMKMAGGLHVTWKNNEKGCEAIEGERKSSSTEYKRVFTIPNGDVDNKHDAPLTAGETYTYRVRCQKGGVYSPYSNEKTGSP